MDKIQRVSFYVARLFDYTVIIVPMYIILQWLFVDAAYLIPYEAIEGIGSWNQMTWTPWARALGCCSQVLGLAPFLGIVYLLAQVCHRYEVGAIFTQANALCYYQLGKLLFFDALLMQPISGGLWVLATTLSNPVGQRCIRISFGTPNVMALLMGLLVIFISWVMLEGSKIQEEQQLII